MEMELTRASKKVTIVLPDEQADEDVGGADGTATHDSTGDRDDGSVRVSVSGQDYSSVSLHGEADSYVATGTGGSVMPEYGSSMLSRGTAIYALSKPHSTSCS
jgi:hypothetical protein